MSDTQTRSLPLGTDSPAGGLFMGSENSVIKGLYGGGESHGGSAAEFCESEPARQARGAERRGGWGKESQARRWERTQAHSRRSYRASLCQHCSEGLSTFTQNSPDKPHFRKRRHREVSLPRVTL